jgi:hypothetical protein
MVVFVRVIISAHVLPDLLVLFVIFYLLVVRFVKMEVLVPELIYAHVRLDFMALHVK